MHLNGSVLLNRMVLALAAATVVVVPMVCSAAPSSNQGEDNLQEEFSGLTKLPADLKADDVSDSLPGRWAVMRSDIVSGPERAYEGAIIGFCERQPWILKTAGTDIAGFATKNVGVTIRRRQDARYLIEFDRNQYYAHLGLKPVDPADPKVSVVDKLMAARTDASLRRSSSFFRYSADVLVETDQSERRIWRRCPERP